MQASTVTGRALHGAKGTTTAHKQWNGTSERCHCVGAENAVCTRCVRVVVVPDGVATQVQLGDGAVERHGLREGKHTAVGHSRAGQVQLRQRRRRHDERSELGGRDRVYEVLSETVAGKKGGGVCEQG